MNKNTWHNKTNELGNKFFLTRAESDYNALYDHLKPYYIRVGFKYVKSLYDSETLFTDMMTLIWTRIETYKPEFKFYSWVGGIYNNCMLSFKKKENKYVNIENNYVFDNYLRIDDEEDTSDDIKRLRIIIDDYLHEPYKSILKDSIYNGLSIEDIMNKYNISKQTVKNKLFRARLYTKKLFKNPKCKVQVTKYSGPKSLDPMLIDTINKINKKS